jgi:tRNA modification GTPase
MTDKRTIVALSSGSSRGAIAVIRLSGPKAFSFTESCLVQSLIFNEQKPKIVGLYTFINPKTTSPIDQITAVKYKKPQTFTGEDMVELFCHGSEIIIEKILSILIERGAVYAEPGEFTKKAFLNGKIDLVKAEAINRLITSRSERELESSVGAYFGGYRKSLLKWKNAIKRILRDVEAKIEFPGEEDVIEMAKTEDESLVEIIKDIEKDIKNKEKIKIIEKGINIPIVGIPNAGKSSLFNLLLEDDRSIVHWEEGTTRDSISEEVQIGKEKVRLLDTAGLRNTEQTVEQKGIEKTEELIRSSALVIWVTPADRPVTEREKILVLGEARPRVACIISKKDLAPAEDKTALLKKAGVSFVSSCLLHGGERETLVSFLEEQIGKKIGTMEAPSVIQNKRQEMIARNLIGNLTEAREYRKNGDEIYSRFLQKALDNVGQIIGETTNEEVLNSIFSEFCVGK